MSDVDPLRAAVTIARSQEHIDEVDHTLAEMRQERARRFLRGDDLIPTSTAPPSADPTPRADRRGPDSALRDAVEREVGAAVTAALRRHQDVISSVLGKALARERAQFRAQLEALRTEIAILRAALDAADGRWNAGLERGASPGRVSKTIVTRRDANGMLIADVIEAGNADRT